jgi:hypothetical protein
MALDAQEMTDALDYQSKLWVELAKYLQGSWKALAEAFERFRLDATFINDVGLARFLPIYTGIASNLVLSLANPHAASGTMVYENNPSKRR